MNGVYKCYLKKNERKQFQNNDALFVETFVGINFRERHWSKLNFAGIKFCELERSFG